MQQINFYRFLPRRQALRYSANHVAVAGGVAAAVFLLLAGVVSLMNASLGAKLKQAEREKQVVAAQLEQSSKSIGQEMQRDIEVLQAAVKRKQNILGQLRASSDGNGITFSQRLEGLGRQNIQGLWLESISLLGGGRFLSFQGITRESELVPVYLQRLATEKVFSGMRFDILKIQAPEQDSGRQLSFEITALPDIPAEAES